MESREKVEIWHRAIQTQMHFAELSIKMRQIGITLAGGTMALAVVLYKDSNNFSFDVPYLNLSVPVSSLLCISSAIILWAARTIDVGVYHRMLRGAVKFNEVFERQLDNEVGWEVGLTETISAYSRFEEPIMLDKRDVEGKKWKDRKKVVVREIELVTFTISQCLVCLLRRDFSYGLKIHDCVAKNDNSRIRIRF